MINKIGRAIEIWSYDYPNCSDYTLGYLQGLRWNSSVPEIFVINMLIDFGQQRLNLEGGKRCEAL